MMVMLTSRMFLYCPLVGALHCACLSLGQQMEHGCAAHKSMLSDCCAGPIQTRPGSWHHRALQNWELHLLSLRVGERYAGDSGQVLALQLADPHCKRLDVFFGCGPYQVTDFAKRTAIA